MIASAVTDMDIGIYLRDLDFGETMICTEVKFYYRYVYLYAMYHSFKP